MLNFYWLLDETSNSLALVSLWPIKEILRVITAGQPCVLKYGGSHDEDVLCAQFAFRLGLKLDSLGLVTKVSFPVCRMGAAAVQVQRVLIAAPCERRQISLAAGLQLLLGCKASCLTVGEEEMSLIQCILLRELQMDRKPLPHLRSGPGVSCEYVGSHIAASQLHLKNITLPTLTSWQEARPNLVLGKPCRLS